MPDVRTTVPIDDDLLDALRREAKRARVPLRTVLNRALRLGLERIRPSSPRRSFRQRTFHMGFPPAGNLDKALQLAALLEDEEAIRKLGLGR
jgi:hypothetical protein